MKTLLISAAAAAVLIVPSAASAQAVPPAVVAVVDLDRVTSQCNACKTAIASLQSQATAEANREKELEDKIAALEAKLARKDAVIAEVSEELVALKKELGEP